MDMRNNWTINDNAPLYDMFYSPEETTNNVKENFDLRRFYSSEGKSIEINGISERCLVQMPSNPLRELNDYREIHCPIDADVKRGYYVKYENTVWIIDTNVADVDGAYLSTRMSRCQYLLRWQNKSGDIIERWSYSSDQTKYSNGETGNGNIMIGDNQYALLLPIDSETKLLKRNMRFAMDFEDSEEPDVYRLTNRKVNLNNETYFDRGGTMLVTLSFDVFSKDYDKKITLKDGRKVWICNYNNSSPLPPTPSEPNETTDLRCVISGNVNLKNGYRRTYTATFTDKDGKSVDWQDVNYQWNVKSDFDVKQSIVDNRITISVNDENLIGGSFFVSVYIGENMLSEIKVNIIE